MYGHLVRESVLCVGDHPVLVGCGTGGASVNVSDQNGMQGKLHAALPWLLIIWSLHVKIPLPVICSKI